MAMTSTLSRTSSAAISAARSLRPSAQRYSIATVRPSIQPSSRNRCTKGATHWLSNEGVLMPMNPIVGNFAGCCARAASGHAAAPPSRVIRSRRLMGLTRGQGSEPKYSRSRLCQWRASQQKSDASCPSWVSRVASGRPRRSWHVRYASNSDPIGASRRSVAMCHYVWPGHAVQDGLPRSTNVRAASMYQASEVEQFAPGHHGYPRASEAD